MKFLVLGCNGMAGHTISLYLKERGHDVTGFDRVKSSLVPSVAGDARDTTFVRTLILQGQYDSVINCIGILNQHAQENKDLSTFLNAYFPHFLADITSGTQTQVIQMSTDFVFSGKQGDYTEHDFTDGESFYDRTKALGELEDEKNITLRNSVIGPDRNPNGEGLMNWFMGQSGPIQGFTKAFWTGQTSLQLAKTMEAAAAEKAYGLYHAVPDTAITKCDLLMLLNRYFRNGEVVIRPVDGTARSLSLKRTNHRFAYQIPDYEVMVAELAQWVTVHKALYPHYGL